jgi:adenylosuccinate synthase
LNNITKALNKKERRPNSVAVIGAFFGDEGKGRITDELADYFLNKEGFKKIVIYRDNGGANAGHTISHKGKKISLHQIGSGILHKGAYVVLGKGMVIHPSDVLEEIEEIKEVFGFKKLPSKLMIDQMATLCLDTHRAFEFAQKNINSKTLGSKASTNRGISPAYADVLYRYPLNLRDLYKRNWKDLFLDHYDRNNKLIKGLGFEMKDIKIQRYKGREDKVGSKKKFIKDLEKTRKLLKPYVYDMYEFVKKEWNSDTPFIFEKAQAIGLDYRWGIYPDISASNCCLDGITYSTEGIINSNEISARLGVIKSTYSSSVGKRIVPTKMMDKKLANRIREDANEYGATTKRPRDILHTDLVMLKYFCKVSGIEELVFTHMDIVYDEPVKVCTKYKKDGKYVGYRPDQEYLMGIEPVYKEFKPWDSEELKEIKSIKQLDSNLIKFMDYISSYTDTEPVAITYGPERNDTLII